MKIKNKGILCFFSIIIITETYIVKTSTFISNK